MRILAVDVGEKRIGVAISDETATIALPHSVIEAGAGDIEAVCRLAAANGVGRIVVGMPTTLQGTRGPAADRAQQFIEALRRHTTIPVVSWDERLTTVIAERAMLKGDATRRQRRRHRDKVAATVILQSYLQAHSKAR